MADPVSSGGAVRSRLLGAIPHGFSDLHGAASLAGMPDGPWVRVKQIHSARVVCVDTLWDDGARPEADAMVTAHCECVLSIVTADCAPVLLADNDSGVVGAAHAGWRGAVGGVIGNTVQAMVALGAQTERIVAAIGPTIAQATYEVDDGFLAAFGEADRDLFLPGRAGHWQFDLPGFVHRQLQRAGVEQIEDCALDTYADPARFHSFRRATHKGGDTTGRQISVIALP